ncbi:MAG: hypothetical protein AAF092_12040 [Pseudomonadota bacterium]
MSPHLTGALMLLALPVSAQVTATCTGLGADAGWRLELLDTQAEFFFPAATRMDIPHTAFAEGAEWPRALSLIGDRDTAIVILHDRACPGGTHEAQVLTQRGQSPILLHGCCAVRP